MAGIFVELTDVYQHGGPGGWDRNDIEANRYGQGCARIRRLSLLLPKCGRNTQTLNTTILEPHIRAALWRGFFTGYRNRGRKNTKDITISSI